MAAAERISITGVYHQTKYLKDGFLIGFLEDGETIKGAVEESDELTPLVTYQFFGRWKTDDYGEHFRFDFFVVREPHNRVGVVAYLEKYAENIGPVLAGRLFDIYGSEAIAVLKSQPEECAKAIGIPVDRAVDAAESLRKIEKFEDTKIQLTQLFHGRGFPGKAIDECVKKWNILAPTRIRRDPFCMLVSDVSGAGFARCDKLYRDLGLPVDRLKRQVICIWHTLREDSSGDTWLAAEVALAKLKMLVSEGALKPKKALRLGIRARWLAAHKDKEGRLWVAEDKKASNEKLLAKHLLRLQVGYDQVVDEARKLAEKIDAGSE